MDDAIATPVDRAKNILSGSVDSADPAVAAALAQAWALLAIAERLEELAQVTREGNQNPLALTAAPFATKSPSPSPSPSTGRAAVSTPGFAETAAVLPRKRRPTTVLRVAP